MLTKGAIGNLINRYTAVLKKCHILNTFGSLAVASMLVLGGAGVAWGVEYPKTDKRLSSNPDTVSELWWDGLSADSGGAGSTNSGFIIVKDGLFSNNTAKNGGGAIYFSGGEGKFTNVTFENNKALRDEGGAIKVGRGSYVTLTITNTTFKNNDAAGQGGAISVERLEEATLTNTTFIGNKARGQMSWGGGAICNMGGTFTFIGTNEFKNNTTIQVGGAIRNQNGTLNFNGLNTFSGNRSKVTFDDNGDPVQNTGTPNDIYNSGTINVKAGATLSMDGGINGSGKLTFESGSTLLIEDASKLNDRTTPLIDGGTLTVDSGAKLKLNKAVSGETYRIAGNLKSGSKYWTSNDIILTSLLLEGEAKVDTDQKGFTVEVSGTAGGDIAAALPGVIPVLGLSKSVNGGIDTGSDFMGLRFLSRATDTDYLPVKAAEPATAENTTPATPPANRAATYSLRATRATPGTTASTPATTASTAATAIGDDVTAAAVKLVNEVARAAVTVGVQNTALRISDAAADLSLDHLSLANHDKASSFHSGGSDFWAAPLYGNLYSSGMALNSDSVRGQFGGLALGADTEIGQIAGGKVRVGAALNGGGGQSETKGTLSTAQNDYDFGGLSFYAGWNKGAFNLIGSLGYGFGNHEVEMALPASLEMGTAKADIDTSALTADLRAEYELKAGWLNVVPHIGLRYTMLKTDAHELAVPGGVMTEFASDTQNILQLPVGVALSANTTFGGWTVKPGADFSFIPACGETDASTRMHFTGVDAWDSVNSRIMDSTSYAAELSLKAEKGNFSLGLSYGVQSSSHETDQNIQFKLGWKF